MNTLPVHCNWIDLKFYFIGSSTKVLSSCTMEMQISNFYDCIFKHHNVLFSKYIGASWKRRWDSMLKYSSQKRKKKFLLPTFFYKFMNNPFWIYLGICKKDYTTSGCEIVTDIYFFPKKTPTNFGLYSILLQNKFSIWIA